jgi:ubiquinol oxidase
VTSYTQYLGKIDAGRVNNLPAPKIVLVYWKLAPGATLRDVAFVIREDEAGHRDRNHAMADALIAA